MAYLVGQMKSFPSPASRHMMKQWEAKRTKPRTTVERVTASAQREPSERTSAAPEETEKQKPTYSNEILTCINSWISTTNQNLQVSFGTVNSIIIAVIILTVQKLSQSRGAMLTVVLLLPINKDIYPGASSRLRIKHSPLWPSLGWERLWVEGALYKLKGRYISWYT